MEKEMKAKVYLALTAMLEVTKAKNHMSKALLAYANGTGDAESIIKELDAFFEAVDKAKEEGAVFRNVVRDDRPKHIKTTQRMAKRGSLGFNGVYSDRDLPRSQQDPKDIMDRIIKSMKDK